MAIGGFVTMGVGGGATLEQFVLVGLESGLAPPAANRGNIKNGLIGLHFNPVGGLHTIRRIDREVR